MASFVYIKKHGTLVNLDTVAAVVDNGRGGVVIEMPDGKRYDIGYSMENLIGFLHIPHMGNKVGVVMGMDEYEKIKDSK